ncbi:MAG: AAA family ATPase [Planctomycetes bacterium]|nr:AAA family ATPase [Planctomycetota bacterium]
MDISPDSSSVPSPPSPAPLPSGLVSPSPLEISARAFTMPPLVWGSANLAAAPAQVPWLWQGYLAPGALTVLTSQWKAGKTTLASVLLARMKSGGHLASLPVTAGKAVVISEEGLDHWHRRHQQLDFGDHVGWFCRPFRGKPSLGQWSAFLEGLADLHPRLGFSLVVIDPWAAFLPGDENHAASTLAALAHLQRLTSLGLSVLLLHHPGKGDPAIGQAARGSGALSGSADILIEMRFCPGAADNDRRRRLYAFSRYPETPRRLVVEWSVDGTDYLSRGTFLEERFSRRWQILHTIFVEAAHKLNRHEVCLRWPGGRAPNEVSVGRWLERAVDQGLLRKDGRGLQHNPFRYWLPEREAVWRQDPIACCLMPELLDPAASPDNLP